REIPMIRNPINDSMRPGRNQETATRAGTRATGRPLFREPDKLRAGTNSGMIAEAIGRRSRSLVWILEPGRSAGESEDHAPRAGSKRGAQPRLPGDAEPDSRDRRRARPARSGGEPSRRDSARPPAGAVAAGHRGPFGARPRPRRDGPAAVLAR